jgi:hypothetical protein
VTASSSRRPRRRPHALRLGALPGAARRLPFTLATLALLVAFAIATHTVLHPLSPELAARFGFAPVDLTHPVEWWRAVLSACVTLGGRAFWGAVVGVVFFVGASEWRAGPAWAAAGFWGGHLGSLLVEALVVALPAWWLGLPLGKELATVAGVGLSAGYLGSLGLFAATLPRPWDRRLAAGVLLVLVVMAVIPVGQGDDRAVWITDGIVHLLAFSFAFGARVLWQRRQARGLLR